MKWLVVGLAVLGALAVSVTGIGWWLPVAHTVQRQHRLAAPPEAVWRAITEIEAFPAWRPDVSHVERLPDREGRGVWTEEGSSGRMTFAIERSEAPRLLVTRIEPGLPFGGTWTYDITPDGAGSLLTITENGEVYNPIFRFMSRFIFGHESTMTTYLSALERRLLAPPS